MKKIVTLIILIVSLSSCGSNTPHNLTDNEKIVLDSLQNDLKCQISIGSTKHLLRFDKPYDFEITLSNIEFNKDSLGVLAQYVAQKYYPYINEKERYKNLIVNIQSKTEGNVGVGSDVSYTFKLDEE